MEDERKVTTEMGKDLAKQYGINYFETSAKMNIGLTEAMEEIFE